MLLTKFGRLEYRLCFNLYRRFNCVQSRSFSLQSVIDSVARSQSGFFKTLSESTPVEYCQKFLINVHDVTGLPWWASIICSTVMLRSSITLPLAVYQNYIIAKLEMIKLEMDDIAKELKKETSIAVKMYNWDERTARITFKRSVEYYFRIIQKNLVFICRFANNGII